MKRRIGPNVQICGNSGLPFAMVPGLHQCNVYIKMELRVSEPKNVILISVRNAHFEVWACKEPGLMQRRIGPTVQICGNSELPIAIVPCLHQCNVYIKRKLRVCRAQKSNPCFVAKSPLRRTGAQTGFIQRGIGPTVQICGNSGLPIAMVPCLHQCNAHIKRKLRVCRAQKCNPCFGAKCPLRSMGLQRTRFNAAPYRADSTNLREFGATYRHSTVFAPMQCLYQKEAKGMQSPKI